MASFCASCCWLWAAIRTPLFSLNIACFGSFDTVINCTKSWLALCFVFLLSVPWAEAQSQPIDVALSSKGTKTNTPTAQVDHLVSTQAQPNKWHHVLILNDINGAYGSVGYSDDVKNVVAYALTQWQISAVVSPGDLVAGQSLKLVPQKIENMWRGFEQQILTKFNQHSVPFFVALGNHDGSKFRPAIKSNKTDTSDMPKNYGEHKYANERHIAEAFWLKNRPQTTPFKVEFINTKYYPFYYSVALYGSAFVFIDASGHQMSEVELAELEGMLAETQKFKQVFVVGHLPLSGIAKNRNRFGEVLQDTAKLLDIFKRHKVTAYISGHQHAFYPGKFETLLLINAGGFPARPLIAGTAPAKEAISILSLREDGGDFYVTTYDAKTFKLLEQSVLPNKINGYPLTIDKAFP